MNRPIILGPVPLLLGDSLVLPVNYSSKTSTGVLNPFDVFILIALFSHFEEDAQKKKNWLRYSTVDFSQEKANRHIKKKPTLFGL